VEFVPDHFYFFRILHILNVLFGVNGQECRDVSLSGGEQEQFYSGIGRSYRF